VRGAAGLQQIERDGVEVIGRAYAQIIDFSIVDGTLTRQGKPGSMQSKQLRARARRKARRGENTTAEVTLLYGRSVDQWDIEELAKGMPRRADGTWPSTKPAWLTRALEEEASKRFRDMMVGKINMTSVEAINLIQSLMRNNRRDAKGKPVVPPSTKAELAKWVLEHVVGKPTQRVEAEVGVKLQGVLAHAIVMPGQLPATGTLPQFAPVIQPASTAELEDRDDDDDE
jgi:hypothetical protein